MTRIIRLCLLGATALFASLALLATVEIPPQPQPPPQGADDTAIEDYENAMMAGHRSLSDEQREEQNRLHVDAYERRQRLPLPDDHYDWLENADLAGHISKVRQYFRAQGSLSFTPENYAVSFRNLTAMIQPES